MIQSVRKAMEIFDLVLAEGHLSLKALSNLLGMPKSTVAHLAQTLESGGYLYRDKKSRDYYLSYKLLRTGFDFLDKSGLRKCIWPVLKHLFALTDETVNFTILDDTKVLYLMKIESNHIYNGIKSGTRAPLHCTASGKALLSSLPTDEAKNILDKCLPLEAFAKKTIVDIDILLNEIRECQGRGYAISDYEMANGVQSIAAPIKVFPGLEAAAISIAWPSNRSRPEQLSEWGNFLVQACQEIALKSPIKKFKPIINSR